MGDIETKHFRYNRVSFFRKLSCIQSNLITNYCRMDFIKRKSVIGKGILEVFKHFGNSLFIFSTDPSLAQWHMQKMRIKRHMWEKTKKNFHTQKKLFLKNCTILRCWLNIVVFRWIVSTRLKYYLNSLCSDRTLINFVIFVFLKKNWLCVYENTENSVFIRNIFIGLP